MNNDSLKKVLIIAEAGVNHNGSIELAKKLIEKAAEAGADVVKFQTFCASEEISKFAEKAEYQKKTTDIAESQLEMVKKLELDENTHIELMTYCIKNKIKFLSTPFENKSVDLLDKLGLDTIKIPSGEITNVPYLRKIGKLNKNLIVSTGMAKLGEIEFMLDTLTDAGTSLENIIVLHCNTEYPTPMEDVNLNAMLTIKNAFGVKVGYSDHTNGIEVPVAAAALGACVIEKHFTLDRTMEGPDHKASLEPDELKAMIKAVRNIELALGTGIKKPSHSELKNIKIARKSIVARRDIKKGEILSENNITAKRPAGGISPERWDEIIGKTAKRDFSEDEMIEN
ncbi:MAG: N-acetylneuraminate synthase [Candidatus Wallbacteria bacterium]